MSVLLLNATFEPLHVVSMRRAVCLVLSGKAELLEAGDGEVRSVNASYPVPAVIRLMRFVNLPFASRIPLTRKTLSIRDENECQIAGCNRFGTTIDHIVPRSRGGMHEWKNVALMCQKHNRAKADNLLSELGWRLKAEPRVPSQPYIISRAPEETPVEWEQYLAIAS